MKRTTLAAAFFLLALPPLASGDLPEPQPTAKQGAPGENLQALKEGLPAKEAELARLRRKWTTSKGRTPTKEELKEFEKKQAKGAVKPEDNPYVNKSPLSSPGYWRAAYYEKLAEIKKDKETIERLEREAGAAKP